MYKRKSETTRFGSKPPKRKRISDAEYIGELFNAIQSGGSAATMLSFIDSYEADDDIVAALGEAYDNSDSPFHGKIPILEALKQNAFGAAILVHYAGSQILVGDVLAYVFENGDPIALTQASGCDINIEPRCIIAAMKNPERNLAYKLIQHILQAGAPMPTEKDIIYALSHCEPAIANIFLDFVFAQAEKGRYLIGATKLYDAALANPVHAYTIVSSIFSAKHNMEPPWRLFKERVLDGSVKDENVLLLLAHYISRSSNPYAPFELLRALAQKKFHKAFTIIACVLNRPSTKVTREQLEEVLELALKYNIYPTTVELFSAEMRLSPNSAAEYLLRVAKSGNAKLLHNLCMICELAQYKLNFSCTDYPEMLCSLINTGNAEVVRQIVAISVIPDAYLLAQIKSLDALISMYELPESLRVAYRAHDEHAIIQALFEERQSAEHERMALSNLLSELSASPDAREYEEKITELAAIDQAIAINMLSLDYRVAMYNGYCEIREILSCILHGRIYSPLEEVAVSDASSVISTSNQSPVTPASYESSVTCAPGQVSAAAVSEGVYPSASTSSLSSLSCRGTTFGPRYWLSHATPLSTDVGSPESPNSLQLEPLRNHTGQPGVFISSTNGTTVL